MGRALMTTDVQGVGSRPLCANVNKAMQSSDLSHTRCLVSVRSVGEGFMYLLNERRAIIKHCILCRDSPIRFGLPSSLQMRLLVNGTCQGEEFPLRDNYMKRPCLFGESPPPGPCTLGRGPVVDGALSTN